MKRFLPISSIAVVLAVILNACNFGGGATPSPQGVLSGEAAALELTVQSQTGVFDSVGDIVAYQYVVTNKGTTPLAGPVAVADDRKTVACPDVGTVGDNDAELDPGESLICSSSYELTQADLNAGSITSHATASAGGVASNTISTVVQVTLIRVLEVAGNAAPAAYNRAEQVITFAFVVKNTGTAALGPAQFVLNDSRLGSVNCGAQNITLEPGASISCSASYTTSENDRTSNQLVFSVMITGGGATSIQPLELKIANNAVIANPPAGYTRGDTIKHSVQEGEWLLQIVRCYGADFDAVKNANPQVKDPAKIWPVDVLTIPNIGSNGTIFGPPCVVFHTAKSTDTWESIARDYNADLDVLLEANQNVSLTNGATIRVPRNSAKGNQPIVVTEPIRLNFPSGSDKVTLSGILSAAKFRERHILTAAQGQNLSVTLTAPAGGLELAVLPVNGVALKPQSATLNFTGAIPASGDYYIDILNVSASDKSYTLEVVLSTPIPPAAERVVDINPGTADSNPAYLAAFNGKLYFSAAGLDNAGTELWRFDSVSNTLERVKDIFSGAQGSSPAFLAVYKNELYFSANGNDGAGIELWRFNGNDAGRLSDIHSGPGDSNPSFLTEYNGRLYFSANGSDGTGVELWQTDGVTVGRVTDIYSGAGNSNPSHLVVFNNALYFSAVSNDGAGTEIWKYDGSTASRVTDIYAGVGNANPSYLTLFNNALYFSANANDGTGSELWKYDGSAVSRVADINPGAGDSNPAYLTVFNGVLFFTANGGDGAGYELWRFNGSNFSRAADINRNGDSFPSFLVVYNTQLYFSANGGDGAGRELWRYKGP
jgi:ELWxxDGT repeat protein